MTNCNIKLPEKVQAILDESKAAMGAAESITEYIMREATKLPPLQPLLKGWHYEFDLIFERGVGGTCSAEVTATPTRIQK